MFYLQWSPLAERDRSEKTMMDTSVANTYCLCATARENKYMDYLIMIKQRAFSCIGGMFRYILMATQTRIKLTSAPWDCNSRNNYLNDRLRYSVERMMSIYSGFAVSILHISLWSVPPGKRYYVFQSHVLDSLSKPFQI